MMDDDVLGAFREDPLPPSGVDVAGAVRAGRRHRRVRTAGVACVVALVLTVGGFAVPAWLAPGGSSTAQPGATPEPTLGPEPPPCPSPIPLLAAATAEDGTAPAEFDVLRRWVNVDALSDLHLEAFDTARYWQRVTLFDASERFYVEVVVYAGDGEPAFGPPSGAPEPLASGQTAEPADPVGDRPASWLPGRQGVYQYDAVRLSWQWADGGWAYVAVADTGQQVGQAPSPQAVAALRTRARHVAQSLTIGRGAPVTMPFTASGALDCDRLTRTSLYRGTHVNGTPFSRTTLTFSRVDNTDPLLFPSDQVATVTANSVATPADKPGSATQQVDGHPAAVDDGTIVLYGVDGFALEVSAPLPYSQLLAYTRSVQVVDGAHDDESKWTDQPLRP